MPVSDVPPPLLGRWAMVAGRIDGGDFALGRGGAATVFDEWTISAQRVQCSWGTLGVSRVDEQRDGRIALVSIEGARLQFLFASRPAEPPMLLAIAYVEGREKMRGLLVPHGSEGEPGRDWLAELRAAELEAERALRAPSPATAFVMESEKERLVFEEPPED